MDGVQEGADLLFVFGEAARREGVVALIGECDPLFKRVDLRHHNEGDEELILEESVRCRKSGDHRWRNVEALRKVALCDAIATDLHLPVALRLVRGGEEGVNGALIDDWPKEDTAHRWVANLQRLRLLYEQLHELIVHGALNVDAAIRRALLPAESERGTHHSLCRLLKVGVLGDDRWILSAHLHDDRLRIALRK